MPDFLKDSNIASSTPASADLDAASGTDCAQGMVAVQIDVGESHADDTFQAPGSSNGNPFVPIDLTASYDGDGNVYQGWGYMLNGAGRINVDLGQPIDGRAQPIDLTASYDGDGNVYQGWGYMLNGAGRVNVDLAQPMNAMPASYGDEDLALADDEVQLMGASSQSGSPEAG